MDLFTEFGVHSRDLDRWTFHERVDAQDEPLVVYAADALEARDKARVALSDGHYRKVRYS